MELTLLPRVAGAWATGLTSLLVASGCGSSQEQRPPIAEAATEATTAPTTAPTTGAGEAAGKRPLGEVPSEQLVRLQLLADTTTIALGQPFSVGARFDIAPGWHIYWINPGESGLSTEVEFTAPRGFAVGAPRFPGPSRFDSPGEITSYGYHELVMVSAEVTPPRKGAITPDLADTGAIQLVASASWLACRDVCIRGQAEAGIALPIATAKQPAHRAHPELFAAHTATLPTPLAALGGATSALARDPKQVTLKIEVPGADRLAYFPSTDEDLAMTGQASSTEAGRARLLVSYKPDKGLIRPSGVVAAHRADDIHYYTVAIEEK